MAAPGPTPKDDIEQARSALQDLDIEERQELVLEMIDDGVIPDIGSRVISHWKQVL